MAYGGDYQDLGGNYLLDHWRGNQPLARSLWINGGLIVSVFAGLRLAAANAIIGRESSLRFSSTIAIIVVLSGLAGWVWGAVGIWRASARHHARGGEPVWAAIARLLVLTGLVTILFQLPRTFTFLGETTRLAAGEDTLGAPIAVRIDGAKAYLTGRFALGSADRVRAALAGAPQVTTVYFNSPGGRIAEAVQIGDLIKARHLNTVASGPCLSACPIAFVAGKQRSLLVGGRLGFHQPRYPGLGEAELAQMSRAQRSAFVEAHIPQSFIDQSLMAPPEQMWLPNEMQLFAAGFVNAVTTERVIADNAVSARQLTAQLPKRLDAVTTMTGVKADGTTLTFRITLAMDRARIDVPRLRQFATANRQAQICNTPMARRMVQAGAIYVQAISDRRGLPVTTITTSQCFGYPGLPGK